MTREVPLERASYTIVCCPTGAAGSARRHPINVTVDLLEVSGRIDSAKTKQWPRSQSARASSGMVLIHSPAAPRIARLVESPWAPRNEIALSPVAVVEQASVLVRA